MRLPRVEAVRSDPVKPLAAVRREVTLAVPKPRVSVSPLSRPKRDVPDRVKVVHGDNHSDFRAPKIDDPMTCKARPKSSKSKGGGSRAFVPWCDKKS